MQNLQNRLPRNGAPVAALLLPPIIRRVTNCAYNPQFERVELLDDQNQVVGPVRFRHVGNAEPKPSPRKSIGPFWAVANVACLTLNVMVLALIFLSGSIFKNYF